MFLVCRSEDGNRAVRRQKAALSASWKLLGLKLFLFRVVTHKTDEQHISIPSAQQGGMLLDERAREIITNEMAQTACFPVALLYSLTFYPSILSSSVSRQSLFLSPVIIIQHKKVQKKRNGMLLQQIRRARAANAIEERNQFPSLSSLLIPGRVHGPREVGIITLDVRGRPLEWTVGVGWAMGPWWWMRSCRPSVVAGSAAQWQRQHR